MVQIKSVDKPATEHWEVIVLTKGGGAIELLYHSRSAANAIMQELRKAVREDVVTSGDRTVFIAVDLRGMRLEILAAQVAGFILRPVRPSALASILSSLADQESQSGG